MSGECIFTSKWNGVAARTYDSWFGELPHEYTSETDPADLCHTDSKRYE